MASTDGSRRDPGPDSRAEIDSPSRGYRPVRALRLSRPALITLTALLALAVAFGVALFAAPELGAGPTTKCGTQYDYYSDASYTTLIGVRGYTYEACGCQLYGWGSLSFYRTFSEVGCRRPGPRHPGGRATSRPHAGLMTCW